MLNDFLRFFSKKKNKLYLPHVLFLIKKLVDFDRPISDYIRKQSTISILNGILHNNYHSWSNKTIKYV